MRPIQNLVCNLFHWKGGLADNIVPAEFKVTFDIRITPKTTVQEFEEKLKSWIIECEGDDADSGRITFKSTNVKLKITALLLMIIGKTDSKMVEMGQYF